ncbi:hypothetical protein HYV49_02630 [Candidatus Pacearchaeota archaeon]|nr:hypothetical protein [Candidatus Pacearchaeota archaeon]
MQKKRERKKESKGGSKRNKGLYYLTFFLVFVIAFILFSIIFLSVLSAFPDRPRVQGLFKSIKELDIPLLKAFVITGRQVSTQTTCSSISQYGITWTFSSAVECGTFVNGDYWVVGPVTISSVSPAWDGTKHGSMIDPIPLKAQGYDSRASGFGSSARTAFPVTISGVKSLISSIGLGTCATGGGAECLSDAAVLTVVNAPVASGTFRPPYVGNTTKTMYTVSQIDWSKLPLLQVPAGATLPGYSTMIKRPWIDHGPKVWGAQIHPRNNMPPYPRDSSLQVSTLALLTLLDIPARENLTIRMVQLGIDLYTISIQNGDAFKAIGGFGSGRKWPILFAGIMLDHSGMKSPPPMIPGSSTIFKFGEDGHTYYGKVVSGYPQGKPLFGQICTYNNGNFCTDTGDKDCRDPDKLRDDCVGYKECCTSHTWVGAALAVRLMNALEIWNHNEFFDYVDRYVMEGSQISYINPYGNDFIKAMWNTYRNAVVGTGPDTTKPIVSLSSPADGSMKSFASHSFNASISDNVDLDDAVFYLWNNAGSLITTNTQIINGKSASVSFSYTLPSEGRYFWNYKASDNSSNAGFASFNFSLVYDPSAPTTPSLNAVVINENQVDLSWSGATDSLSGIASYILYRDSSLLGQFSGTLASYSDTTAEGGRTYSYKISAINGAGLSSGNATASATTPSDTNPPSVNSITASVDSVAVVFNEQVTKSSAETLGNYAINNGINILSAILSNDNRTLILGTSSHNNGNYTLNAQNVGDIAGNVMSSTFVNYTFSESGQTACVTSSSIWQYFAIPSQSETFTAEFDATPNNDLMDGVTGLLLSTVTQTSYQKLAAIFRFNPSGNMDVRNSSSYKADIVMPYTSGTKYHVRMDIDIEQKKYNVYVIPQGGSEQLLANNYNFRTDQANVNSLDSWSIKVDSGSHSVCGFTISDTTQISCIDNDGDGYSIDGAGGICLDPELDCNDANNAIYPGATELCNDEIDNNCANGIDEGCSLCGNGIIDSGEICDDGSLNGQANYCNAQCTGMTSGACGDAVCDSSIGESCSSCSTDCTCPPPQETTTNGGGGGGGAPRVIAKPVNETILIPTIEKIELLEGETSSVEIDKEESIVIDVYGSSYELSFVITDEGVVVKSFSGDYLIPRNEVTPVVVGNREMFIGIERFEEDKASIVMGLDEGLIKQQVEKGVEEERTEELKSTLFNIIVAGIVVLLVVLVIVIVAMWRKRR